MEPVLLRFYISCDILVINLLSRLAVYDDETNTRGRCNWATVLRQNCEKNSRSHGGQANVLYRQNRTFARVWVAAAHQDYQAGLAEKILEGPWVTYLYFKPVPSSILEIAGGSYLDLSCWSLGDGSEEGGRGSSWREGGGGG